MLSFLTFLFGSRIGNLVLILFILAGAFVGFKTYMLVHDHNVKQQAAIEFNAKQMEILKQNNDDLRAKVQKLEKDEKALEDRLAHERAEIDKNADSAKKTLDRSKAKGKNDQLSPFMKETIRKLENMG